MAILKTARDFWDASDSQWRKAQACIDAAHLDSQSNEYHYYMSEYHSLMARYHALKDESHEHTITTPTLPF